MRAKAVKSPAWSVKRFANLPAKATAFQLLRSQLRIENDLNISPASQTFGRFGYSFGQIRALVSIHTLSVIF